ncbi:aspartate kinase [Corynebacterium ulcerans]|nr:aspartokinase [Corynebacterium ulcerans]
MVFKKLCFDHLHEPPVYCGVENRLYDSYSQSYGLDLGVHPVQMAPGRALPVALVVQKYGGSSLESAERIRRVAERIVATKKQGNDVVVVCSAMGDTTDELLDLASQVNPVPPAREMDMLLTAGERISNALVAMAIESFGAKAQSFTGSQAGVITTERHGNARIVDVTPGRVREALDEGKICLVAGFQGVNRESKDVTTLGRGGSDTTAVALAAALNADVCEIYSDVDGVYTADPRIVSNARKLDQLCFEEMLELAASGSKILVLRSVEYARAFGVPLRVRSSYSNDPGTLVAGSMEDIPVEEAVLSGVATDNSEAKITVLGIPDSPGAASVVFRALADAEINIDTVLQNISSLEDNRTDITFTCPRADGPHAMELLHNLQPQNDWQNVLYDDQIGKVSLVGAGMKSHPGVTAEFCEALRDQGINIELITTSEIRISVLIRETDLPAAARALHEKFELGGDEEAKVYAGTGR